MYVHSTLMNFVNTSATAFIERRAKNTKILNQIVAMIRHYRLTDIVPSFRIIVQEENHRKDEQARIAGLI